MSNITTITKGISYDNFIKHKDYFDTAIIQFMTKQQRQIIKLEEIAEVRQGTIQKQRYQIKALRLKKKDLEIINYNLKQLVKDTKDDAESIIKEMDKEIKNINKRIDGELQKSYEDNTSLYDENTRLKQEIERLKKMYEKKSKHKKMDSSNSSMPPSTNIFKNVTNSRMPSNLKRGGQEGHELHRSIMVEKADRVIKLNVQSIPKGAQAVYNSEGRAIYYRTQEVDAYMKTVITETQYFLDEQGKTLTDEEMKRYAINPMSYAPTIKSMMLYLNSKGTIASERLCIMMSELSAGKINVRASTLMKWHKDFYEKSKMHRETILKKILESNVVHVDETGWKINKERAWMHVMVTKEASYFEVTEKRGNQEEGPQKHLETYKGCLIHDHYKPYYSLHECRHGECNAHVLRYLKAGFEFEDSLECMELIQLFREMNKDKKEHQAQGKIKMSEEKIEEYTESYHEILKQTLDKYWEEHPNIKKKYVPDYIKLMKRLREYSDEHLLFINDFTVPFDNNAAERQMRPTKAKKKISGQSITKETANYFAAIHTINQTCVLQSKNTLETIKGILS